MQDLIEKKEAIKDYIYNDLPDILESGEEYLTEEKKSLLYNYSDLLLEWNQKINLISRKSEVKVIKEGLLESLSLAETLFDYKGKLLDVGSGGGFPGIVLGLVNDNLQVNLLDSIKKKTMVLNDIIHKLGRNNFVVHTDRVENIAKKMGSTFDFVTTRGVGKFDYYLPVYFNCMDDFGSVFVLTGEDCYQDMTFKNADIFPNPYFEDRVIAVFSR